MATLPELLLIDKPKGITSFDVIRRLRKIFTSDSLRDDFLSAIQGAKEATERGVLADTVIEEATAATQKSAKKAPRMGHAGTLDPLASGLMLIGVGPGTKKLTELVGLDKEYEAEILLGERRSTGDMEGEVLEEKVMAEPLAETPLKEVLESMVGTLRLPVSAYSAIKKGGVPMYKRARKAEAKGETVDDVPVRDMVVHEADYLESDLCIIFDAQRQLVKVRFTVGSGTYIRSLAEEFGKRLGYPATLYNLRRTKVGKYDIKDAVTLE